MPDAGNHDRCGKRAGLQGSASYAGTPTTGIVMSGTGVARVEASNDSAFVPGDVVVTTTGWQDYSVQTGRSLTRVDDDGDLRCTSARSGPTA